jgi:hypothetical protein
LKRTEEPASEPPFLGQILESLTISQVRVRVCPLLDAMTWSSQIARITAGEAAGVQEVVQSRGFRIISLQEIQEIAFVFTELVMKKKGIILQGMGNGYVCWMTDRKEELESGSIYSFHHFCLSMNNCWIFATQLVFLRALKAFEI